MQLSVNPTTDDDLEDLRLLAPAGYFIGLHIRFTSPMLIYQTYDQDWVNHYTVNAYVLRDPATTWEWPIPGRSGGAIRPLRTRMASFPRRLPSGFAMA